MKQVHLKANWLPDIRRFRVIMQLPERTEIEVMDEVRFLEFVARIDREIVISGWKVRFNPGTDRKVLGQIRGYFKAVRDSYLAAKAKGEL